MGFTLQKALDILEDQHSKLSTVSHANFYSWLNQTVSYYKDIFGDQSHEYLHLKDNGGFPELTYFESYQITEEKNKHIEKIKNLVLSDIETLKNKGVYKIPAIQKVNFLFRIKEGWLIFWTGILLGAIAIVYNTGYWYGQHDCNPSKEKSTKTVIMPPSPIPDNKTNKNGDTSNEKRKQ